MTITTLDEELPASEKDNYDDVLGRLSRLSVTRHFDAYADVDWDAPEMRIDPADRRWVLSGDDPLGATAWYQEQPADVQARIGLHLIVTKMKTGLEFESVLKRGLLEYAATLPNHDPEFRYAYHEVIEEAQHSLMFQEFVNRSGLDARGMPADMRVVTREIVKLGRRFPPLFFLFVLGGEDPIDYVQRDALRGDAELHPLLERIMRIHVTEEARHLSFARHFLKRRVPQLRWDQREVLAIGTPLILGGMAQLMLEPSRQVVRTYQIPKAVIHEAYRENPDAAAFVRASLGKVRTLAVELGIVTPVAKLLWKAFGIWED